MVQGDKPKPDSRRKVLRDILVALFATPATLSVLSTLDKRLDFAPLLERLILNFQKVATAVWRALSNWIGFDLSPYTDFLTFAILMLGPLFAARIYRWMQRPVAALDDTSEDPDQAASEPTQSSFDEYLIPLAAFTFVLFLAWLFQVGNALLFLYPAITLTGGVIFLIVGIGPPRHPAFIAGGMGGVAFAIYEFWRNIGELAASRMPWDVKLVFLVFSALGVWLVWKTLREATRTIAFVGFWVAGIILINFIVTRAIPAIDSFLTRAGA